MAIARMPEIPSMAAGLRKVTRKPESDPPALLGRAKN